MSNPNPYRDALERLFQAKETSTGLRDAWQHVRALLDQPDMSTADALDAARYRLLRNGEQELPAVYLREGADDQGWSPARGAEIDEACDALIAKRAGGSS